MSRSQSLISAFVLTSMTIVTFVGAKDAIAQPPTEASLTIKVENVKKHEGKLMVALFSNEADWKASKAYQGEMVSASADSIEIVFRDVAPGEYGVKMFHDANDDGELNTGNFGIPTEPYGFSNDAPANFGPPRWGDAKFALRGGGNDQTIHLK